MRVSPFRKQVEPPGAGADLRFHWQRARSCDNAGRRNCRVSASQLRRRTRAGGQRHVL